MTNGTNDYMKAEKKRTGRKETVNGGKNNNFRRLFKWHVCRKPHAMKKQYEQKLEDRVIAFSASLMFLSEQLPRTPAGRYLSDQLLRCGLSPALNYSEAQGAESNRDFVHKMKVCLKELRESYAALRIITLRDWIETEEMKPVLRENNELIAMFVTSIKTSLGKGDSNESPGED